MDDREFQQEVQRLIESQQRKERLASPYILESLRREKEALIAAFHDHFIAMQRFPEVTTVEEFLESLQAPDSLDDQLAWTDNADAYNLQDHLNELMMQEVERLPELLDGEMQISGESIFMHDTEYDDDSEVEVSILEAGATLMGTIQWYCVESMPSYEAFLHTQSPDTMPPPDVVEHLGLWVMLQDVTVKDGSGVTIGAHQEVLVPVSYPSVTLHKVIRQHDAIIARPEENLPYVDIWAQFRNDFILETCRIFENDVNYNEREADEKQDIVIQHQDEVAVHMSGVDGDTPLLLEATEAYMFDGSLPELVDATAYYLQPVFLRRGDTWRIHHAFEVHQGGEVRIAHILPEHLVTVRSIDE